MWGVKMKIPARAVHITLYRAAVESVFDECDRYDSDETGGRLIGTYRAGRRGGLSITVSGVIEPGPGAERTVTSFFQDGSYQESVFRTVESKHPEIEHLGNWHTHHVNGYPTLSAGDRETYHRIVNHANHNTDFFYALLVTAKNAGARAGNRYSVKHFILYRGEPGEYEIPNSRIHIVDRPVIWPVPGKGRDWSAAAEAKPVAGAADQRAKDSEFFKELVPGLRPFLSKKTGKIYWRGRIALVDESAAEIVVAELDEDGQPIYKVAVAEEPAASTQTSRMFSDRRFRSAREAVVLLERELNREIFRARVGEGNGKPRVPEDR